MVKRGRPFTYQSEDEKPVTVSLRIPRDLHNRMSRYAAGHRQSVTELLLDGLTWRLEQEDWRQQSTTDIEHYDNTVLQEMTKPAYLLDESLPFDEDMAFGEEPKAQVLPDIAHYNNTVIQESKQPAPELQHYDNTVTQEDSNTVIQEKASGVKKGGSPHAPTAGNIRRGQYKLNRRQVRALRAKRQRGVPIKALMEEYGLSKATVFRYLAAANE